MFVQGRIIKVSDVCVWLVLAFLLGLEFGHWLFLLLWGMK